MSLPGILQILLYIALLVAITKPVGAHLARVFNGERTFLDVVLRPLERLIYRLTAVNPEAEQGWVGYTFALLLFTVAGALVTYAIERLQNVLPFNPQGLDAVPPDLAFNTAVSFTTNTNWQNYAGEATMSYFTQMAALAFHNWVSAAAGIAIAVALTRGLARRSGRSLGNFWVDVVRCTLYVLLPICFIYTLFLVWQGVPQNLNEYTSATTLEVALGWLSPTGWVPFDENVGESLKYLVMPAVTLGVGFAAPLTRFLRSGMLDVMGLDYMRTARSKGLPGRLLVLRHALKNALLPVVTVFGLFFGGLLGGAVLTESVFSWPGLGRLLVDSIEVRDYGVVQGVVLFVTLMFALVNLVVDLSYAYLDPRIRFEG